MGPFAAVRPLPGGRPGVPVPPAGSEVAPAEARPPLCILLLARVRRLRLAGRHFLHNFLGQFFVALWG